MKIQITLDANSYLRIIPIKNNKLCFDYNQGYCVLKTLSLINAFFYELNDKVTKELPRLINGESLIFYYHNLKCSLYYPEQFRKYLKQLRGKLELNKIQSKFFEWDDNWNSAYTNNKDNIRYGLLEEIDNATEFDTFEVRENFDDNMSVRLVYKYIINNCQIIKTVHLEDGGIQQIFYTPDGYNALEINHFNKSIQHFSNRCSASGWKFEYRDSGIDGIMVWYIWRSSNVNRAQYRNSKIINICYDSYKKLH